LWAHSGQLQGIGIVRYAAEPVSLSPTDLLAALFSKWERIWVAVCETVGIAFVGSNQTPATIWSQ
jgi:hypothetical protein